MKEDDVDSIQYSDYEGNLLNFMFNIRAEAVKFNLLLLREPDPPGQEMGFYTQLGCDVLNKLSKCSRGVIQSAFRRVSNASQVGLSKLFVVWDRSSNALVPPRGPP